MHDSTWKIFWVVLIFQYCDKSLSIFFNWIQILGEKTLLFLSRRFQETLNGEIHINEFESGLSIIDTTTYHDFKIDKKMYGNCIYTIWLEMRYTCDQLFRYQYIHLRTLFIPLCFESPDRYYFNLLSIITLLYHIR